MSATARARLARLVIVVVALSLGGVVVARASTDDRSTVRSAAHTTRTARLGQPVARPVAAKAVRPQPGSVFVVGDSLTVGTEPYLRTDVRHRGWRLTGVDARIGRPVAEGLQVLRARRSSLPGTVLIALGTNDLGAGRSTVASWLRSARKILGHRRVIWVNLCLAAGGDPRLASYRALNALLDKLAPRYGVQVANWCAYAHAHHVQPGPDHIHYTSAGYRQRASFYAAAISS